MVDKRKIAAMFGDGILDVAEDGDTLKIKFQGSEKSLKKSDVLQENCATCIHRNPVIFDELVGELVTEQTDVDRYADVRAGGSHDAAGKMAVF